MMQAVVSICCLGYNHARYAVSTLSKLAQSGVAGLELVVVDDGSTDESAQVLDAFARTCPVPINLILQRNTGRIGHNFNVALRAAHGEYVTFMSLDDELFVEQLSSVVSMLQAEADLAFVASPHIAVIDEEGRRCDERVNVLTLTKMQNPTVQDLLDLEFREFGSFYIQGCYFRKALLDEIGGFDEDVIADDIVLRTKLFRHMLDHPQWRFRLLKTPLVKYRRHGHNVSNNFYRQIRSVSQYLDVYWPQAGIPPVYDNWFRYALRKLTYAQTKELFAFSKSASTYRSRWFVRYRLAQKRWAESAIGKVVHELAYFAYHKEKHSNGCKYRVLGLVLYKS